MATANGSRGRPQGKCNRKKPPRFGAVRMERRGKSSPAHWRLCGYVNPVRSNIRMGHMWKPRTSRRWHAGGPPRPAGGALRQRKVKIDRRLIQNPAYGPVVFEKTVRLSQWRSSIAAAVLFYLRKSVLRDYSNNCNSRVPTTPTGPSTVAANPVKALSGSVTPV